MYTDNTDFEDRCSEHTHINFQRVVNFTSLGNQAKWYNGVAAKVVEKKDKDTLAAAVAKLSDQGNPKHWNKYDLKSGGGGGGGGDGSGDGDGSGAYF